MDKNTSGSVMNVYKTKLKQTKINILVFLFMNLFLHSSHKSEPEVIGTILVGKI